MIELHLTGPLGQQISVQCDGYEDSLAKQREWGSKGFASGSIPAGGYQLPYCMADTFDVSLIGGRRWTTPEGEEVILHGGRSYKRREMAANEKKNMPAVIKYSRGAKGSDPEHLKEGEDGGFQYVTLISFRGNGKAIADYETPSGAPAARPAPPAPAQAQAEALPEKDAPPIGPELGIKLSNDLAGLLKGTRHERTDQLRLAAHIVKRPVAQLADLTADESRAVYNAAKREQEKAQTAA